MAESRTRIGFAGFEEEQKFGMISRCLLLPNLKACWTHTDSSVFAPSKRLGWGQVRSPLHAGQGQQPGHAARSRVVEGLGE